MKVILLATVPHTGTWFMVEFFRSHPMVSNFVEIQVLQKASNLAGKLKLQNVVVESKFRVSDAVNLIQGHFGYPVHEKLLLAFAAMCPLIIPLRDPLLGLIGLKNRDRSGQTDFRPIVEAWRELAEKVDAERDFYQPFYLPLDLMGSWSKDSRAYTLRHALYRAFGISPTDGNVNDIWEVKLAQKWAEEWPHDKHNSRGMYPLKEAYLAGDVKKIRDAMPKAYYFLEQAEDALRPMLEREGYRELMWWTAP